MCHGTTKVGQDVGSKKEMRIIERMGVHYKIFTISELRDWLVENQDNGISTKVIDSCRAYSWLNNPSAKDEDPALAVVFDENDIPIGYTGAFSEIVSEGNTQGRFFWGSTEWLDPEYRGKGIAATMMNLIKEAVGYENYFASDSSEASVRLDKKQGSQIQYYQRMKYVLSAKESFKGRCASSYVTFMNNVSLARIKQMDYANQYVTFVDEETYAFMRAHSQKDLFLRQRETLNWMLHFPFLVPVGEDSHAEKASCEFGSIVSRHSIEAIKVKVDSVLRGFYIVSQTDSRRSLRYLYYEEEFKENVFASVTANLIRKGVDEIQFFSVPLHQFMQNNHINRLNSKSIYDQVAFTSPGGFCYDHSLGLQGGDGDMFC